MTTPTTPQRPLPELLAELELAVLARDRDRATLLEQAILQRLAAEAADLAAVERRVRELMAELERATARVEILDPFNPERSGPSPDDDGVVYPVWFGTNRKPT